MQVRKWNCGFLPASLTRPLVDVRGCRKHFPRRQGDEVGDRSEGTLASAHSWSTVALSMRAARSQMKGALALITISTFSFLFGYPPALALDPSLEVSQYARTTWRVRNGFSLGNIYAIAQTPDGYLWLGTEFGLVRFDGVRSTPWQPPAGEHLPDTNINALLGHARRHSLDWHVCRPWQPGVAAS